MKVHLSKEHASFTYKLEQCGFFCDHKLHLMFIFLEAFRRVISTCTMQYYHLNLLLASIKLIPCTLCFYQFHDNCLYQFMPFFITH